VAELKTKKTTASVSGFLKKVADPERRADCEALVDLMRAVTKEEPRMWGASIVGFGSYVYKYGSGRTGEWPLAAFSPRKQNLTVYLMDGFEGRDALMAALGKHTTGKWCLYFKRLSDLDRGVLKKLVAGSFKAAKAQFAQK
jgi:Domain of unknown function (DU1801)